MQEDRQQLPAMPLHDRLELAELLAIFGLDVAEGRDQQRNAIACGGVER
jgi:hypothetical protein